MFSKATRFPKENFSTPAPGQYDVPLSVSKHSSATSFGSVSRFKDCPDTEPDKDGIDLSTCSGDSASTHSIYYKLRTPKPPSSYKPPENKRVRQLEAELCRLQAEVADAHQHILLLQNQLSMKCNDEDDSAVIDIVTQSLQTDLETSNERIKLITARNQQLEKDLDANRIHRDKVEEQNLELHRLIGELTEKAHQLTKDSTTYKQTAADLKDRYDESQKANNTLKDQVELFHRQLTEKTDELERIRFDMSQQQDVIQMMTTQLQSQEVEMRSLATQVSVARIDIDEKQSAFDSLSRQLAESQQLLMHKTIETDTTIQQLKTNLAKALETQSAESACVQKIDVVENEKNTLITDLRMSNAEIERLKEHTSSLQDQCSHISSIRDDMEASMREKQEKVDELVHQVEAQEKAMCTMSEKYHDLEMKFKETTRLMEESREEATVAKSDAERVERCRLEERSKSQRIRDEMNRMIIDMRTKMVNFEQEIEKWRTLFEKLHEKCRPFQEQLDQYEAEKEQLMNERTVTKSQMEQLGRDYAQLIGHQNHKQKIHHLQKMKDENFYLKQEVMSLRAQLDKHRHQSRKAQVGGHSSVSRHFLTEKRTTISRGDKENAL
ncbi:hyaluronan-mediated motility receptor-like isoform X2 [Corticium candelabrum]|uniref:hyaluronan-mediated motility receptor-like isoform X2 n=1 Tax=Corticium candelabrum TaxID=121492 RepID=UPI002E2755FD|nr:hyaluronan-mediated motility receptor-like isoform X2 [Corticium candelabrum]